MLVPAHRICSLSLRCRDKGDFIHVSPFQDSFSWCGWLRFVSTWNSRLGTNHALRRCNPPSLRGVKLFVCVCVCCALLYQRSQILWDGSSLPWLSFVKAGGHCCDLRGVMTVEFWALYSLSSSSGFCLCFLINPLMAA